MTYQKPKYLFTEIGSSSFEKFVSNERSVLVDKTLFIRELIEGAEVTLITRPRRWGKTLNMSMLEYFFCVPVDRSGNIDTEKVAARKAVFKKMKIGKEYPEIVEEHCCKYPVIFVSFKDIKDLNYQGLVSKITLLIRDLYIDHIYLSNSDELSNAEKNVFIKYVSKEIEESDIGTSIGFLSKAMFKHFGQKVILLIDEYDSPMNDWYGHQLDSNKINDPASQDMLKNILNLFSRFFGFSLKDTPFLHRAVITGILRIAKANLFSGVNNLVESSILSKEYASHFGFTEGEVLELLYNCDFDENEQSSIEEVRSWYNGYNIGGITIYNPWSIMNYLRTKELRSYWVMTASTSLIENAFVLDEFQEEIQGLIEGKSVEMTADPSMVFADIHRSPDAFYNLLLFSGYLTTKSVSFEEEDRFLCEVRIPNREVRGIFNGFSKRWLGKKFKIEENEYSSFITNLISGDVDLFVEKLRRYLEVSSSYHLASRKNAEVFYNGFILGLISSLSSRYLIESEKESGLGRADLILIPKSDSRFKIAFVIELKFGSDVFELKTSAKLALDQINAKNYASKISEHSNIDRTIKLGLAFSGKEVEALWE